MVLIPCRPSALDLATIPATLRLAQAAGKPTAIVLNACPARAPEVGEALEVLATYDVPIVPVTLGDRRAYARAYARGQAVTEFEARGRAAQEVTALWQWIVEQGLTS
jgi:chromosome partitioning protein